MALPQSNKNQPVGALCRRRIFVVAFGLNLVWEVTQLPTFEGILDVPLLQHVFYTFIATMGDGLFIAGIYGASIWWRKDPAWIE